MHGTGWLIRPDLLVTAGHCTFDWGHNLGPVVEIKAYIGYDGKTSVTDPKAKVQFRSGKRVATTLEWITSKGQRKFDVGFVQLDSPFTDIVPWKFDETPFSGSLSIGVVGYPGDLRDERTKEMGAHMYEMFLHTNYNLAESHLQMLQYEIDTAGGKQLLLIQHIKLTNEHRQLGIPCHPRK
jgi:V8-like Glu-specific endopeptidase